ncbi:MAG: hypothetical protein AAF997_18255 [Myxococcota bacterium]
MGAPIRAQDLRGTLHSLRAAAVHLFERVTSLGARTIGIERVDQMPQITMK